MAIPTEITFHELDVSPAVEAAIARSVDRLEHVFERIESCVVRVNQPHRSQRHGRAFQITITLAVPGRDVAISHVGHEDIYVAIADAFRAARRRLLEQVEIRRGFVKSSSGVARESGRQADATPARFSKL
jgi:ribosome-associated translation inhibitor RaiA